jgi:hypothetical protein
VGLSKASGLFGLRLHGICNFRNRITAASGKRSDSRLARTEIERIHVALKGRLPVIGFGFDSTADKIIAAKNRCHSS